jgi:peptidoglycan/LPS O-acetylase OafA/YrhL
MIRRLLLQPLTQTPTLITYRPDIDGLRALAILPVVLFHAGVPGFSGGFVGVDVFFVISGFLITTIIRDEMAERRFSIAVFYERRARRILPAFFLMMAVCVLLAAWTLFPHQFLAFSRSVMAASVFASSFLFRSEAGYFDLESEQKPLLHTWSLSVEEIFYIVFPLLLLAIRGRSTRSQVGILICISLVSLAASSIALHDDPRSPSAFFLPYSRAWELMLGALLAYAVLPPVSGFLREGAALAGIGLILTAVLVYSEGTVFPGLAALMPCVGAGLLIYAGQHGATLGGRLLSQPPVVWVGKVSYSLYLWHWPLLVLARAKFGDGLGPFAITVVVALSVLLAALSTIFVEQPFRGRSGLFSRRQVFAASAAGILLFAAVGLAGVLSGGWAARYPPEVASVLFAEQDRDPRQRECLNIKPENDGCLYGDRGAEPVLALWGDSHAAVYSAMLGGLGAAQGESILAFTMPSCPPADGWALPEQSWRQTCLDFQRKAMARILGSPSIGTVILSGRFDGYPIHRPDSGFEVALRQTIRTLRAHGKTVLVTYPVPEPGEHLPSMLGRILQAGEPLPERSQPVDDFRRTFADVIGFLDRLVASEAVGAIRPSQVLCERGRCVFYRDGIVYYYDEHHLSLSGAERLKGLFRPLF